MCSATLLSCAACSPAPLFESSRSALPLLYLQTGGNYFRSMGNISTALGLPPPSPSSKTAPTGS
jgi:hypothetical protein